MHWYPTHVDPHLKNCLIYSHNHHSLLQVTSIRSQTNARNHFLQLRENNWRSKCTHLIHTNDSIQTSCNDLCCVFVETTTCDLKRVRKSFDALMSTLIPQLQFTVGIRNTLHVPSSLQLTIRLSFFFEASTPFTKDAWPFSFLFNRPNYPIIEKYPTITAASHTITFLSAPPLITSPPS